MDISQRQTVDSARNNHGVSLACETIILDGKLTIVPGIRRDVYVRQLEAVGGIGEINTQDLVS